METFTEEFVKKEESEDKATMMFAISTSEFEKPSNFKESDFIEEFLKALDFEVTTDELHNKIIS